MFHVHIIPSWIPMEFVSAADAGFRYKPLRNNPNNFRNVDNNGACCRTRKSQVEATSYVNNKYCTYTYHAYICVRPAKIMANNYIDPIASARMVGQLNLRFSAILFSPCQTRLPKMRHRLSFQIQVRNHIIITVSSTIRIPSCFKLPAVPGT